MNSQCTAPIVPVNFQCTARPMPGGFPVHRHFAQPPARARSVRVISVVALAGRLAVGGFGPELRVAAAASISEGLERRSPVGACSRRWEADGWRRLRQRAGRHELAATGLCGRVGKRRRSLPGGRCRRCPQPWPATARGASGRGGEGAGGWVREPHQQAAAELREGGRGFAAGRGE